MLRPLDIVVMLKISLENSERPPYVRLANDLHLYPSEVYASVKRALTELSVSTTPLDLPVELPGHGPELKLVTRGAEQAGEQEIADNPRSASVRLRAAERIRRAS